MNRSNICTVLQVCCVNAFFSFFKTSYFRRSVRAPDPERQVVKSDTAQLYQLNITLSCASIVFVWSQYCYKSVQRFRVTCLFTGQYDTREYGTIAGVLY